MATVFIREAKKRSKYGAKKVIEGRYTFDSKAEHKRWCELKILQRAGKISDLRVHTALPIFIHHIEVCSVESDFDFFDEAAGKRIYIDVKGAVTPLSALKAKLVSACYPGIEWRIEKIR